MTKNFCDFVQKNAEQLPDNIAVEYLGNSLTYYDLDRFSSLFANKLIEMGIKPGNVVGVGLFNSIYLVVGILGVLKAGGVYLPLDPNYPTNRINQMVIDSNTKLILVDDRSRPYFEALKVDKAHLDVKNLKPSSIRLPIISPEQPAYIVYTSGSTGIPKGIAVSHNSLKHSASSFAKIYPFPPCSLLSGSISFDPSILIVSHALYTGGKICLYDNTDGIDLKNFAQIIKLIRESKVDFILSTPSFYSHILKQGAHLCSLKNIFLCGEKIHAQLIHDHILLAPGASLYNTYGPSEYAIGSTAGMVYDSLLKQQYPVNIGKPFGDNKLYVLDNELNPVCVGEKGEFFVGGPGLAIGYVNQKSLTAEKFIRCSHLEEQSIRLYRTGDIGYQLGNGEFIFSGRKDFQVKIHGHRVELEEIESTTMNYKGIEKAVAVVEDETLVVFYSANSKRIAPEQLKKNLESTLPSFMIPQRLLEVQEWPITNNGKVDLKSLIEHGLSKTTQTST